MFQPNERVTVDLSGLVIQGVSFSQNVQKALGTILQQVTERSIMARSGSRAAPRGGEELS